MIRAAAEADIPYILEIERECFPDPWPEHAFRNDLIERTMRVFVSENAGKIDGFLCLRYLEIEASIDNIAVPASSRGKGIATALVIEALGYCAASGVKDIFLEVDCSNIPAIRLYEKFGFVKVSTLKSYYSNGNDAWLMKRIN